MAHTFGQASAHASGNTNPVNVTFATVQGETVLVLMFIVAGATNRTGGSPTFGGFIMTQANTTQKAASGPETSAEMWYLLNPPIGSNTLSIPNAGSLTIWHTIATGKAKPGGRSAFDVANGANATSANPTASVTTTEDGDIIFSVVGTGAQTWNPSAQNGTIISNNDNGAFGDGFQYLLQATLGTQAMGWTFGTSEDWAVVVAAFKEVPPVQFHNYMAVKAGDGISVSEKIR